MADVKYENFDAKSYDGFIADSDTSNCYEGKEAVLFSALGIKDDVWSWIESYEEAKYEVGGEVKWFIKPGAFPQFKHAFVAACEDGIGDKMLEALEFCLSNETLTALPASTMKVGIRATENALTITSYTFDADCLLKTYDEWAKLGLVDASLADPQKIWMATTIINLLCEDSADIPEQRKKTYWSHLVMTELNSYSLCKDDFSDGTIPNRVWVALQGGGGAGATGATFAGDDGDGGGAGGFAMASVKIEKTGKEYAIYIGRGGSSVNSAGSKGEDGSRTWLEADGERLCTALEGKGGGRYNSPGDGGEASVSDSDLITAAVLQKGGKGGDGDYNDGKGESIDRTTVSCYKRNALASEVGSNVNRFVIPGGESPEAKAKGYTGSGGGAALGNGGKGGSSGIGGTGDAGVNGAGGGGGRYLFAGWNVGGKGGDGFAIVLC